LGTQQTLLFSDYLQELLVFRCQLKLLHNNYVLQLVHVRM